MANYSTSLQNTDSRITDAMATFFRSVRNMLRQLLNVVLQTSGSFYTNISRTSSFATRRGQFKKVMKNPFFIPGLVAVAVILFVVILGGKATQKSSNPILGAKDNRVDIRNAKSTQNLNKSFTFSIKDEKGKVAGIFVYLIEKAELRDEIVVEGKKATSVKGRTFLVINLKLVSELNNQLSINARDYVRLTINDGKDKLAADIHNDPVVIQPISTKITRLAFPVNDTDKNLALHVGELTGTKQVIKLTL